MKKITIILLLLVAVIWISIPKYNEHITNKLKEKDLSELQLPSDYITLQYEDTAPFENDRFYIYSFQIHDQSMLSEFKVADDDLKEKLRHLSGVTCVAMRKNLDILTIINHIESIWDSKRCIYRIVPIDHISYKLYVFDKEYSFGYCFIVIF